MSLKIQRFGASQELMARVDQEVLTGHYNSRSEAIRYILKRTFGLCAYPSCYSTIFYTNSNKFWCQYHDRHLKRFQKDKLLLKKLEGENNGSRKEI